ncbi:MAG: hypothetical protein CMJ78_17040 [Planctomycetaceae bacterium]|nr:hypothetical protein [Planctomycetaceae bacterium]
MLCEYFSFQGCVKGRELSENGHLKLAMFIHRSTSLLIVILAAQQVHALSKTALTEVVVHSSVTQHCVRCHG